MKYVTMTKVQAASLPVVLEGTDVLVKAKTGTGKTLAFLLPIFRHVLDQPPLQPHDGPIALISEKCPSVFLAPAGEIFNKIVSSMQEIKARKGPIIAIITEDAELPAGLADEVIVVPACHEAVLPIVMSIPVQLLSYYIAVERGCDVDKPRNLAKSVTVE
jgi:glucosamine--fructose-6-phosphate aminotransferase (isomerizing)